MTFVFNLSFPGPEQDEAKAAKEEAKLLQQKRKVDGLIADEKTKRMTAETMQQHQQSLIQELQSQIAGLQEDELRIMNLRQAQLPEKGMEMTKVEGVGMGGKNGASSVPPPTATNTTTVGAKKLPSGGTSMPDGYDASAGGGGGVPPLTSTQLIRPSAVGDSILHVARWVNLVDDTITVTYYTYPNLMGDTITVLTTIPTTYLKKHYHPTLGPIIRIRNPTFSLFNLP